MAKTPIRNLSGQGAHGESLPSADCPKSVAVNRSADFSSVGVHGETSGPKTGP